MLLLTQNFGSEYAPDQWFITREHASPGGRH